MAILKQLKQWAYRVLWDVIDDSERLRSFCRFGDRAIPKFNTFAENVKRIRVETWKAVNAALLQEAKDHKIEKGRQVRIDTTGVESPIHHPTDSRLIGDCVRVTTRLMDGCRKAFPQANADEAEELGVQAMDFGGKRKNPLTHHVVMARIQRLLRRFRAGIEGVISATKRAYGLDRCTWRGWDGFQRYVWSAIVAWNLQVLARHLLA